MRFRLIYLLFFSNLIFLGCQPKSDQKEKIESDVDKNDIIKENITPGVKTENNTPVGDDFNTVDLGVRPPRVKVESEKFNVPVFSLPKAGEMIKIEGGKFKRGSAPQDKLRDQFAENDHIETEMTPFEMDVLPWPNDPFFDYLTGVTKNEAAQLCESKQKRLCTELEYEWACKSADNRRYISGNIYNEQAYRKPNGIASPVGVWGFGTVLEITDSSWGEQADQIMRMSVRGFAENQEFLGNVVSQEQGRRCAKRWRFDFDAANSNLGFRCCSGKKNEAKTFIERPRPAHSRYKTLKPEEFTRIIRSIPELEAVHENPHMFSNSDIRAVLAKRGSNKKELAKQGIHFLWKPLRWIPRQGMELWLAVGRSNRHSFIVVLHEVEDNKTYIHESSLIIWDNPSPLAIVYREGHRDEVYWAPCWRCRDGGIITFDEKNNQVNITHRW